MKRLDFDPEREWENQKRQREAESLVDSASELKKAISSSFPDFQICPLSPRSFLQLREVNESFWDLLNPVLDSPVIPGHFLDSSQLATLEDALATAFEMSQVLSIDVETQEKELIGFVSELRDSFRSYLLQAHDYVDRTIFADEFRFSDWGEHIETYLWSQSRTDSVGALFECHWDRGRYRHATAEEMANAWCEAHAEVFGDWFQKAVACTFDRDSKKLADLYLIAFKHSHDVANLDKALTVAPSLVPALIARAHFRIERNLLEQAEEDIDEAFRVDWKQRSENRTGDENAEQINADLWCVSSRLAFASGEFDEAMERSERILRQEPLRDDAREVYASSLTKIVAGMKARGNIKEAVLQLESGLEFIGPNEDLSCLLEILQQHPDSGDNNFGKRPELP